MTTELPEGAQKQLDNIRAQLLECLVAGAQGQTEARSEFMRYGVSEGGLVLEAEPAIAHPDHAITKMYSTMFDQARHEGVELREIVTSFRRTLGGPWKFESRWITVDEYAAFTSSVSAIVEELRVALRSLGSAERPDWAKVSFDLERVLVTSRDQTRITLDPSVELSKLVSRIEAAAQSQGLQFTGATWRVEKRMKDAEGEIESSIGVI